MATTYQSVRRICRFLVGSFYEIEIRQLAPLPPGPLLVVANHPNSATDAALLAVALERPLRFFAKASLVENNTLGRLLRKIKAVPAYRAQDGASTEQNAQAFQAIIDAWRDDAAIAIFPEGVSHDDAHMRRLKTGAARTLLGAHLSGLTVPVVPVGFFYESKERFRSRAVVVIGPAAPLPSIGLSVDLSDEALSRAHARALTEELFAMLASVTVNADSLEDLLVLTDLLRSIRGREHLDPLELSAAAAAHAAWAERDRLSAKGFIATTKAVLERSGESGVAPADIALAPAPGSAVARELALGLAAASIEVPVGLAGALGFAPAYWATHGLYKVVGKTGSGGSAVKIAAAPVLYGAWALTAGFLLRRKLGLSVPATAGAITGAALAHVAGPPLLRARAASMRSLLTRFRLGRNQSLALATAMRRDELDAALITLHTRSDAALLDPQ